MPLRVRSMVGLIPLFAVEVLEQDVDRPAARLREADATGSSRTARTWRGTSPTWSDGDGRRHAHRLLAIPSRERLERVLRYVLDENEFLSPLRHPLAVARPREQPVRACASTAQEYRVDYAPGESTTGMFGGNSNWRGPIWFPVNYLLIEALERYHHFYGDDAPGRVPDRLRAA